MSLKLEKYNLSIKNKTLVFLFCAIFIPARMIFASAVIASIPPDVANDPSALSQSLTAIKIYEDTVKANQADLDNQITTYKNQLDSTIALIETERSTTQAVMRGAQGSISGVSTTQAGATSAVNTKYDTAISQAQSSYSASVKMAQALISKENLQAEIVMNNTISTLEREVRHGKPSGESTVTCSWGYKLNEDKTQCISQTSEQECKGQFGQNSEWDGTYVASNGTNLPNCACTSGYQWDFSANCMCLDSTNLFRRLCFRF